MASFTKGKTGWRAQVAIKGIRDSGTFSTKAEASAWAAQRETEIRKQAETGLVGGKTCGDAFDRYIKEVSINKKKSNWEKTRLTTLGEQQFEGKPLKAVFLGNLTSDMLGQWRDRRIKDDKVTGSTVNRDFGLLSHVFTVARREWKWISSNPTSDVLRPKNSLARDRRINEDEIDRIVLASGFNECLVKQVKQRIGIAFLFAIETGMRAGEICGLTVTHIKSSVATLSDTKNGTRREVALSPRALELLAFLPPTEKDAPLFGLSTASLDANFRKLKTATGIKDLKFHDTRHEAITRLAKKLNVLELARMVGHRDLKMLQIYYNETATEIAKKL